MSFKSLWVYADCLSSEECDQLIKLGKARDIIKGTIRQQGEVDPKMRDSDIIWLERNEKDLAWLFEKVDQRLWDLNRNWFDIDIDRGGFETIQWTEYNVGQQYNSHVDTFFNAGDQVHRKLSASILLSEPGSFEGGELFIQGGTMDPEKITRGQIYVFPSLLNHWVKPITSGVRHSLVIWNQGRSWR